MRSDTKGMLGKNKAKTEMISTIDSLFGVQEGQPVPYDTKIEMASLYAKVQVEADKQGINIDSSGNDNRRKTAQLANLVADTQASEYAQRMGQNYSVKQLAENPTLRDKIVRTYLAKESMESVQRATYANMGDVSETVLAGMGL